MRNTLIVLTLLALAFPGRAEEPNPKKAARGVLARYQDAVVAVRFILKQGKEERRMEVEGTVLTAAGLTVVSDFMTNPAGLFSAEDTGRTEATEVKLVFKDGKEVAAKFVLRDRDLDLGFVLPTAKDLKLTHVPLDKTPLPEALDDLIFMHRLGKGLNREASIALGRVEAVVKKPQTFVVPDLVNGLLTLGCPAFDAEGRFVGIVVMRRLSGKPREPEGVQDILEMFKPVILPVEDLESSASQVGK